MGLTRLFARVDLRVVVSILVFTIVVPTTVLSAPHTNSQQNSCTPSVCRSHDSKLRYEEGKSYIYHFESESITKIVGTSEDTSKLTVKGQAILAALSPCDITLTVQKASIQTPNGQAISQVDGLEGSSVRFAYQDGEIEGLCVADNDATWSVNIKRALVSTLQNKAIKNTGESLISESDISGRCPTQYSTESEDTYVKTRNLNACSLRQGGKSVMHGVAYSIPSKYNSIPGVNSTSTCTQKLKDGVFQTITCEESYKLEAFSRHEAGAQTTVKSSLSLASIDEGLKGAKASQASQPSSIFYDHGDQHQDSQRQDAASSNTRDLLKKLCSETESGAVSSKVPGLFLQLKKALQYIRSKDLKSIRDEVKNGQACPSVSEKLDKLLLDAAAMSGSDGSIGLIADIYAAGQLPIETKTYFYMYTTFANRPGPKGLSAMSQLLQNKKNPESQLLLAASGLAHQYCKMTNPACGEDSEYVELVNQLGRQVQNNCVSKSEDKSEDKIEKAVAALQSLGNLDQLTGDAATAIAQCLDNGSERIKIQALDAFRRDPCQAELKEKAKEVFASRKQSSEIRIKAYLAVSKCLQSEDIDSMQNVITKEKSNQVTSFISSHIRNQLESSGPGQQQQQKTLLRQLRVSRNVPEDVRKFSKNYEISSFSPDMNLGAGLESNLIFSQNSFVPRLASLNSTIHAFGRSYNLLEMGVYLEDFEHVLEKYFGPSGKVRTSSFKDIVKNGREHLENIGNALNSRIKRSPVPEPNPSPYLDENEVDAYQKEVEIENRYGRNGLGNVYIRVMGTSILINSFSQNQLGGLSSNSLSTSVADFVEKVLEGAKDHKIDLTQPILFLDDEITVPTISGFPLNFNLEGTTVLSLQLKGNVDLAQLFKGDGGDSNLKANLVPSAATVLRARMSTGAGPVEAGVQIDGKIQSASAVDLIIKTQKGQLDVKINLPQEKIQLLDVRTDLYWVEKQGAQLEKKTVVAAKISQKTYNNDCYASDILGLKFCADIKAPSQDNRSPYFPLNGPSVMSLGIEKLDSGMEGYHAQIINQLEGEQKSISLLLDTPGSKINRKIEAQAKLRTSPTVKAELDVDSPWKKFAAFYELQDTDKLKTVDLGVSSEGKKYGLKAQVKLSGHEDNRVYEPLIQTSGPSGVHKFIEGSVTRSNDKVQVDIKTDAADFRALQGRISANVKVHSQDQGRTYDLTTVELNYPSWGVGKLGLTGKLQVAEPTYALKGEATYGEASHTISIDSIVTRVPRRELGLVANVKSTDQEALNFDLNWEARLDNKTDALEHKFELVQGKKNNQLTIKQHSLYSTESRKNFEITNELQVLKLSSDIDFSLKANGKKLRDDSQVYDFQMRSGDSHQAQAHWKSEQNDYTLKASAKYPGQAYEFEEKAKKVEPDSWKYDTTFSATPGNKYTAVTDLTLRDERNDMENTVETTITSDAFKDPIVFKSGVIRKSKISSAHLFFSKDGARQVDITSEYKQTGINKPHAVNVKAFVNKYLNADLTESHTGATSNLQLNAHWLPTDRKIGAQTTLKLQGGEIFTLEGQLKWDMDRDDSKIAKIRSVTTLPKNSWAIDSTNDLTIEDRTSKLALKGKLARDLMNGEHFVDFTFRGSDDKHVGLHIKNVMESLGRIKTSKLKAQIELLDSKPYELDWENSISNIDWEKFNFDISSDFKFNYEGDRNLNVIAQLHSSIPFSKRTFSGQFGIDGSVIAKPLNYDYNLEWKPDQIKTTVNAKHGTKASSLHLLAKIDRWSAKKTADVTYKLVLPINPKTIEGTLKYGYLFNSWSHFEVTEQGSVTVNNEAPTTWKQAIRTQDNELEAFVFVADEGRSLVNVSLVGRNDKRTMVDFHANAYGHEGKFYTSIEGQFPLNTVRANGGFSSKPLNKNYDFKLNHLYGQGGQSFDTNLNVNKQGQRFVVSNKVENFQKRKSLDLLFTDGTTPRKIYFVLTETTPKWNLDSFIKWGEAGRSITTKGSLETGNVLDAIFSIDSEALKIDKWSARVSKKVTNGRNKIVFDVEGKNEKVASAGIEYSKKNERSGDTYDGSVKLQAKQVKFNGDFRLENGVLDKKRDGEEGRQVKATVQLSGTGVPLKLSVLAKKSDVEKRASVSFCNEGDEDCKIADVILRHEHHEGQDVDYILRATTQFVSSGQNKTTDGIVLRASRAHNGKQYEHSAQLIINEEKSSQIGYRVYQKIGKEVGLDIQLPERIVSGVAKAERSAGHDKAEISIWMDKIRKPETALKAIFSLDAIPTTADNAEGVETLISLKHPALSQELKFQSKYLYGGNQSLLDVSAQLDIFKKSGPIVFTTKATKDSKSRGGHDVTVKSSFKIPPLNLDSSSETKISSNNEVTVKSSLSYENEERQVKQSKLEFALTQENANFAISTPSYQPLASFASRWNNKEKHGSSGYDVRYEVRLPGMEDAQIFESRVSSVFPPHAYLKTYGARNTSSGDYYEVAIGFKNDQQFAAGVYEQTGGRRNVIGALNIALNSSRLLFVKADWEAKNLENNLTDAKQRWEETGAIVKDMLNSYMDESSQDTQYLLNTMSKAMPNLKPIAQAYKNEVKLIKQELNDNEDTKAIISYIAAGERLVQEYSGWVTDVWNAVTDAVENFVSRFGELVATIPEKWSAITNKIPSYTKSIRDTFNSAIDATVEAAGKVLEKAKELSKKIADWNRSVNLDFLNDTTNEVGKYLNQAVMFTVNCVSRTFEAVKKASVDIVQSPYIKSALTKSLSRYENLLANIINETNVHAETLREYILSAFPQKETQDFVLAVFSYAEKMAKRVPVDDEQVQRDLYEKLVTAVRKFGSDAYTIDLENGLIIAQIPLPKPIDSLTDLSRLLKIDLPTWGGSKFHKTSLSYGVTEFSNFVKADSFVNTIYRHLFATETSIPPVPAYALLVGSMYIRTFDGHFYHFEGNCQYLLASDFVDQNFTIAINFEGDGPKNKKSIVVKYGGESAIIKPDFSTEVKHRRSNDVEQLRIDNHVQGYVSVTTRDRALTVTCQKSNDVCVFALNGFYHGKTMGLLGTYNNEVSDDYSTPQGNVLEKSEDFVASWKLDKQCKEKVIPPHPASATRHAKDQCANAFEDKYSSLRSCYDLVDPAPFQSVCESLSSEKGYNPQKAVCSSSLAYAETCSTSLLHVEPSSC